MLTFDEFKRKLEDECITALAAGYKINYGIGSHYERLSCCCPLGTKFANAGISCRWPLSSDAAYKWNISKEDAGSFMQGYGSGPEEPYNDNHYYNLGLAYKKKFILDAEKNRR